MMSEEFNIYCDESCHLENDKQKVMVLGALACKKEEARKISDDIRSIKIKHGLKRDFEIKWTKISPSKIDFYLEIVEYFFNSDFLNFRAIIIPDKDKLNHSIFNQSHDDWYYKMYFNLLKVIFYPKNSYYIYLDIKDTKSEIKVKNLHDALCYNVYDFSRNIIKKIQQVRSHEIEILQMTDLIIGAISYTNRNIKTSSAKNLIVDSIKEKSTYCLTKSTLLMEKKMNIFVWNPQEMINND